MCTVHFERNISFYALATIHVEYYYHEKYFKICCRQALLSQRGGGSGNDSDKLNPTHVTSSRALSHFDQRTRNDIVCSGDDDDKLLDVVGPPQSPLLPLGHSLSQFNTGSHAGKHSQ